MRLFLYFFALLCYPVFGQSQKVASAQVEYRFFSNSDFPTSYYTTLYIDKDISLFHEKPNENATRSDVNTNDGLVYESLSTSTKTHFLEPYLKVNRNKQEILFFESIGANRFLIQDDYQNLDWTITNESKTIEGFSCTKATVSFRGREWTAWFTTEVPLPFGPWKLYGLPGLILEAYDATNRYTYRAVKIEFKKNAIFEEDFNTLIKTKNKNPISYRQFLIDTQEYRDNIHAEAVKNNPDLQDVPVPNNGMETKYEWEE
ncbi:GLPGLI family protein [Flavobacterium salilacus subsp. salilacus]|uniref:GLPGLI family protein n=1 Tax=Flavobacterium TaxID=237 RepID=UPI0010750992|nr:MULTISPECIES: GLPGLI family protein [Flavobacterium]KAF2520195.1 GLPGLI family protein [Flavobacterium salilacus subsp. salilacus]MBE1613888.1 GLPGLI family protein [Flavobacterium sp. SaA2.13]